MGRPEGVEGAPAELDVRGHGLAVSGDVVLSPRVEHQPHERSSLDGGGPGRADEIEYGREDVGRADLGGHPLSLQGGERHRNQERDMHGVIVDEVAVRAFAVAPQRLAVVADENDRRRLVQAVAGQPIGQAAYLFVHEGDLPVVEAVEPATGIGGRIRLGRSVGHMGIIEVDPGEEGLGLGGIEPGQGRVHDLVPRPLDLAEVEMFILLQVELVVVVREALLEAPAAVEDERGDEGAGLVAPGGEHFGQGRLVVAEGRVAVDPDAVVSRIHAGHDRAVGRERQRRRRGRLLEENAPAGDGVQVRRRNAGVPVAGQMVGPGRVEGDQDDVRLLDAVLRP